MAVNNAINSPLLGGIPGALPFASGGTGVTALAAGLALSDGTALSSVGSLTSKGVLLGAGTAAPTASAAVTGNLAILVGDGTNPTVQTLLGAGTVSIAQNGTNVTITGAASPTFTWSDAPGGAQAVLANEGWFSSSASNVFTLPASPTNGATVAFASTSANSYVVTANTGDFLLVGNTLSTAGGTATSAATTGEVLPLVYQSSSSTWVATGVVGSFTVV